MELSDDEDDSNYCTPASESLHRTMSECSMRPHSNGGTRTRLKSHTEQSMRHGDLASVRSKGHEEVESVAVVTDKVNAIPDRDCTINGG